MSIKRTVLHQAPHRGAGKTVTTAPDKYYPDSKRRSPPGTPAPSIADSKGGEKLLSATRLIELTACPHRVALWLAAIPPSDSEDDAQELLRAKGLEHELAVLERLERVCGHAAIRIPSRGFSLDARVRLTRQAMDDGAPLIYQGALATKQWAGFPDFLVRSEDRDRQGYRPEDAKLSRRASSDHVLQIGVYAELLRRVTGTPVRDGVIHVHGGEPETFDLAQTKYIVARLMFRLEEFADSSKPGNTRPLYCSACKTCGYRSRCENEWRAEDSAIFVAGLRTSQLLKLEAAGIRSMSELAQVKNGARVRGMGSETLPKLAAQARLQKQAEKSGTHVVELLPVEAGRGFRLLPSPDAGDIFLDLEGDPFCPQGLEYLFGLYGPVGDSGERVYRPFWAHSHEAEKTAFQDVMTLITDHLARFPSAHIFHFGSYELTAFKRLAMRHAAKEQELDSLLRQHRFVDLFRVLRQAVRVSTENYSLKTLEALYWSGRAGTVATATDSVVQYERWKVTQDATVLARIAEYNEEDCLSTAKLREWLESFRPSNGAYASPVIVADEPPRARLLEREARQQELQELSRRVRAASVGDERVRNLVAELLWFHQRAQKPQWWAIFERQMWPDDELIDDAESLGAVTVDARSPVETVSRSNLISCKFPPQDTKLKVGSKPVLADTLNTVGTLADIRADQGLLVIKRGVCQGDLPLEFSLLPPKPINQKVLAEAVQSFAERFAEGSLDHDRALMSFLNRSPPRIRGNCNTALVQPGDNLLSATIRTILQMDRTALFIQGPPGAGKTFTASHAILALLKSGKRVAISSNSHKAINLLLAKVEERAFEDGFAFVGVKKSSAQDDESDFDGAFIDSVEASGDVGPEHQLVGGTVFHFAQEAPESYDHLFIDEAGQVALGNLVAMASCAKNIVLIGDQMQLQQPVQGVHPAETGLSCLAYLLQDQATISADRGILLNVSYRMHPALCKFVSEAIYDGRLTASASARQRQLVLDSEAHPALQPAGLSFCIVRHAGCTQSSFEEANAISTLVHSLLRQHFLNDEGATRPISLDDILIVSPFNMQVSLLRKELPAGARVGTVDKFQGQEAPVVIVSMATSHGDDAPRGTGFLFSRNRFNVAISRAQCLAIVVQSPKLLDVSAGSIEDLVRLDLFARAKTGAKVVEC